MEMRSTPLRGGRPAKTHISPFPQSSEVSYPKDEPHRKKPTVEKPFDESGQRMKNFCFTPECLKAALELKESMDLTVDPCEDFFKYTCGNWIAKNPIPPAANAMTIIKGMEDLLHERIRDVLRANPSPGDSVPVRDAKTLYAACVNTATLESLGLEPLTSIMKNYGRGWPMTLYGWNGWDFDWQETAAAWMRNVTLNTFISAYVGPDDMNTDRNVLY
ncbi:unnamed protein product, partial [Darwinula stevensoni]